MKTQKTFVAVLVLFYSAFLSTVNTVAFAQEPQKTVISGSKKVETLAATPLKSTPSTLSSVDSAIEDWKGPSSENEFDFGGLLGLGLINYKAGFALLGTVSKKIVRSGFVPDITNSVSLELEAGPLFAADSAIFNYSLHMRWDFQKNREWTFYALGGLAGNITGQSLGNEFQLYPRLGIGALWSAFQGFQLRGELSHELIALGAAFPL